MTIGDVLQPIDVQKLLDEAIASARAADSLAPVAEPDRGPEPDGLDEAALSLLRASPETELNRRWDSHLHSANRPELLRSALESADLRDVYARYIRGISDTNPQLAAFSRVACTPEVLSVMAANTPAIVAGLYGSANFAPGLKDEFSGHLGTRSEAAVAVEFARHAEDPIAAPLPAVIRASLDAVVPAVVAATLDHFVAHPDALERKVKPASAAEAVQSVLDRMEEVTTAGDAFALSLLGRQRQFRALATELTQRVVARGPRPNLSAALASGRLEEFRRSAPARAANAYILRHVARTLAEVPGSDHTYESYLAEHTLGIPRESNAGSQVTIGDFFGGFPELPEVTAMDRGLAVPHKVTLKEEDRLYHPYFLFHRSYAVPIPSERGGAHSASRKASVLELVYGLTPDTMRIFQQVLLGEAAVVGLTEKGAKETFTAIADALNRGEVLDGGQMTPIQGLLEQHVQRPVHGKNGKAADHLRDLREQSIARDPSFAEVPWVTGPRGVTLLLRALGADRPELGARLLHHSREAEANLAAAGILPRARSASASLTVAPVRRDVITGLLTTRTLLECLQMKHVPVLRTPGLAPGETLEKDADATFRLQREIAERALRLTFDPTSTIGAPRKASDDVLSELQTLLGYMVLGKEAYEFARLPNGRSVSAPERLGPGIAESLSGKEGMIRSVFFGTRFDNSGRLKLLPNWRQRLDEVTAPPYTIAVVRGDYLRTLLLDPKVLLEEEPDRLAERMFIGKLAGVFSRQTKSSDFVSDVSKWAKGLLGSIERDGGPEAAAKMRDVVEQFCRTIPVPQQSEARRILLGTNDRPGAFAARRIDQYIADALLRHPLVAPLAAEVNTYYPVMISRYPVIHHHSYAALFLRIGSPETNAYQLHPITVAGLGGDFDGDAVDMNAPLPYSRSPEQAALWREMMLSHSPNAALLNSASGTDMIYRFALNASEGLVKANLIYVPATGVPADAPQIKAADAETLLRSTIGTSLPHGRDELLSRMLREPELLLELQGQWIGQIRAMTGQTSVPVSTMVVQADGTATTLARLFLHEVVSFVADGRIKDVEAALGPRYVRPGELAPTSGKALEGILQKSCLPSDRALHSHNPGDHFSAVYGAFYAYFSAEATTATQSANAGGLNTPAMFQAIGNDPLVAKIRSLFANRLVAIEQASANGLLTADQKKSMLLRLEAGERSVEEKSVDGGKPGLNALVAQYRSAATADALATADAHLDQFVTERTADARYGLKPLAKAAVRVACERFARANGHPHLLVEQILTDKVKASEEVLFRFFMGTANMIDGEAVPTTFGGLVDQPTVERIMKSGAPALDKAIRSKLAVQPTGTAFKEYELELGGATITRVGRPADPNPERDWDLSSLKLRIGDYFQSKPALEYLAHQLTLRVLRVEPSPALTAEQRAAFDQRLRDAVEIVPFDQAAMIDTLKALHAADPTAAVQVRSVLKDQQVGNDVSAEAAGYVTTAGPDGLRIDEQNRVRRVPLAATRCLGYPIGAIMSGALGEMATQAALRTRHITGSGIEEYSHIGDWHKVVHGPFPQRSPFYRGGGAHLRSTNPLSHPGIEACATAFTAKVPGHADQPLIEATRKTQVGGIEIFPGERYLVRGGELVVGTDRPKAWCLPADPAVRWTGPDGRALIPSKLATAVARQVEAVAPSKVQVPLTQSEAAACGITFADAVADYRAVPRFGAGAAALRAGQSVVLQIPTQRLDEAVAEITAKTGQPKEGIAGRLIIPATARFDAIDTATDQSGHWKSLSDLHLVRYRVASTTPAPLGEKCALAPGMIINPHTGLAHTSVEREIERGLSGFDAYLGFLSGKPLDTPAPLALAAGEVAYVKYLADRGQASDYEIAIADGTKVSRQVIRVPAGDVPCVVPGQSIEVGRPLSFGAVDISERSRLRPETAQQELAEYLMASSYGAGKRSPAPVVTELLTRSFFASGTFTPIREIDKDPARAIGENPFHLAGRSGRVDAIVNAGASPLLTTGFGRVHAIPSGERPRQDQMHPVHLFPSLHPMDMPHASVLAERLAAIGLGTRLLEPLKAASEKAVRRAQRMAEKIERATGFGNQSQGVAAPEPDAPMLGR